MGRSLFAESLTCAGCNAKLRRSERQGENSKDSQRQMTIFRLRRKDLDKKAGPSEGVGTTEADVTHKCKE